MLSRLVYHGEKKEYELEETKKGEWYVQWHERR